MLGGALLFVLGGSHVDCRRLGNLAKLGLSFKAWGVATGYMRYSHSLVGLYSGDVVRVCVALPASRADVGLDNGIATPNGANYGY